MDVCSPRLLSLTCAQRIAISHSRSRFIEQIQKRAMFQGLPLHHHSSLREPCADVLNEEWKRSATARLHMLDKSNDSLPYNIVYVKVNDSGGQEVIGHSRLCKVHGQSDSCFVESVIIKKSLRGKGLGRRLMDETEDHARRLGYTNLYLTTHDKQDFYNHIGYDYCEPIISLGSASTLLSNAKISSLFGGNSNCKDTEIRSLMYAQTNSSALPPLRGNTVCLQQDASRTAAVSSTLEMQPPPSQPPPPPPPPSTIPPPSIPPPPPVPLAMTSSSKSNQNMPVRLDPSKVFWMRKRLE